MKHMLSTGALLLILASCQQPHTSLTSLVDPHIGSAGHGHVFVGANVPFGMVQVGPTSVPQEWDWCSGYHASDSTVIGFSHTHLSGTGIGDLFDITVMPVTGSVTYERGNTEDATSGLWSYADRSKEVARPGYYAVALERYNIFAEMTATQRTALHRYTFPESNASALIFDLENGGCWDRTTEAHISLDADSLITGWRHSRGWANRQKVFFAAECSRPIDSLTYHGRDSLYARLHFATKANEKVMLKVALSAVSIEGAKATLQTENPDWDFEALVHKAEAEWNKELQCIQVVGGTEQERRTFYTALYHTMMAPALFSDPSGDYRGARGDIHHSDTPIYTTFSLWDTYRAKMPLLSIIAPERMSHFVNSMLNICDQQQKLPVWHLWGCETNCMVGNPAIPVVADAIVKKIKGIDYERAFQAIETTTAGDGFGRDLRRKYGYIPCNLYKESVAYELEYALADGAAARAAEALGKTDAALRYHEGSQSYRHLFDSVSGFMRGKDSEGHFREPFDPLHASHRNDDYCEGNAWQYTWLVPHDVEGLAACFGGKERMLSKLDSLFLQPSQLSKEASPDISGMIGQYAHGNEPSHHILYMYAMLGRPERTNELVHQVLNTLYDDTPEGLCGNEDVGQMSAWYILAALGLYEVEPASARYWISQPLFERATIQVEGGSFVIECPKRPSPQHQIKCIRLNGVPYSLPYLKYEDIVKGGTLRFEWDEAGEEE
ncbi:MAG: GH92 family glycosyl hydrolase [Bacteroidaceae bacterium]|nr:GH92 family glycosyl hydrolase [Bacteroidaceae bacterium]